MNGLSANSFTRSPGESAVGELEEVDVEDALDEVDGAEATVDDGDPATVAGDWATTTVADGAAAAVADGAAAAVEGGAAAAADDGAASAVADGAAVAVDEGAASAVVDGVAAVVDDGAAAFEDAARSLDAAEAIASASPATDDAGDPVTEVADGSDELLVDSIGRAAVDAG